MKENNKVAKTKITKTMYEGRSVRLANGKVGKILIPGLDACLVQLDDTHEKLWAMTDWDYQRRLKIIENKKNKKKNKFKNSENINKFVKNSKNNLKNNASNELIFVQENNENNDFQDILVNEDYDYDKENFKNIDEYIDLFNELKKTRIVEYLN